MTPTPDESRFVAEDGVSFEALDTIALRNKCADCDVFIITSVDCDNDCPCMPIARKDHRNIVWKREPFNKGVK